MLVPTHEELDWRVSFVAALRAQALVWGGSANCLIPYEDGFTEHPAFAAIARSSDPDALMIHPGSWADLHDLLPEEHEVHVAQLRAAWQERFDEQGIEWGLAEDDKQHWPHEEPSPTLLRSLPLLHHDEHLELGLTSAEPEIGYPWVSALGFPADLLAQPVSELRSPGDLNLELFLASAFGQLSTPAAQALAGHAVACSSTDVDARGAVQAVFSRPTATAAVRPFALSETGCSWFTRDAFSQQPVALTVGDTPWDLAVGHALSRSTQTGGWFPHQVLQDPLCAAVISRAASRYRGGRTREIAVVSASSTELAEEAAQLLRQANPSAAHLIRSADYLDQFPAAPQRLLTTESANRRVRAFGAADNSLVVELPVPRARTINPLDLYWMTDIRIDEYAVVRNDRLTQSLVSGGSDPTTMFRPRKDGVSMLGPSGLVRSGVELEAQVPSPEVRMLDLVEQVELIGTRDGLRCRPSDKGAYTLEAAALTGGLANLQGLVSTPATLALLRVLSTRKQSNHPGRWSASDKRRYFDFATLHSVVIDSASDLSVRDLLERSWVYRGLRHGCPRCRFTSWFAQDELSRELRCARCRRPIAANDPTWEGDREPQWQYRLNEILWQFMEHNGDLALRASERYLLPKKADRRHQPWGLGVEMELLARGGSRLAETDLTVVANGDLWVGEAKSNGDLGSNPAGGLQRLLRIAEHLNAAGVLLVAGDSKPFSDDQISLAQSVFAGSSMQIRIEQLRDETG